MGYSMIFGVFLGLQIAASPFTIIAVVITCWRMQTMRRSQKTETKLIDQYRRMVAKAAWKAWRMLPMQTRSWIGVDDMIADGLTKMIKFYRKHYDPRKATFSTILYHAIHNYYIREYVEVHGAWQRGWRMSDGKLVQIPHVHISALEAEAGRKGMSLEHYVGAIPDLVVDPTHITDNALTECLVVPAMERIYHVASPNLREEMISWFWYRGEKVHTKGKRFKKLAHEFRELCTLEQIECDDCIHLMRSLKCLDSLSRALLGIPYDLDLPTPQISRLI